VDATDVRLPGQEWRKSLTPTFDAPATAAQLLATLAAKRQELADEFAAADAAREAERREAALTVLRERRTTCVRREQARAVGEGLEVWGYADVLAPYWPYQAPADVTESPEALAWLAELEAANATAPERAQKAAQEALVLKLREKAEREAREQEAARLEAERRAELGLADGDVDLAVEDGALTEVPANCWESHSRGKNWAATVSPHPASPGGLARSFWAKAKGSSYYLLPSGLVPGDAVEFGADYYSGRGGKSPRRWYGFVVRVEPDMLVLRKAAGGKTAYKAGQKFAAARPADPEVEAAVARVNDE
jgi:hypothetical protein